jgi:HEAT repeat protein
MYAACQEPDVDALVEKLGSKDWEVSYDAIKKLQNIEGPAVPALIKALKRPEEQMRANAALCLGGFGVETGNRAAQPAVPHLIQLAEKTRRPRCDGMRRRPWSALARPRPPFLP